MNLDARLFQSLHAPILSNEYLGLLDPNVNSFDGAVQPYDSFDTGSIPTQPLVTRY